MSETVPEAHGHKPDPNEPWRYVTPCCRTQPHADPKLLHPYVCEGCGETYRVNQLYDQKRGVIAGPRGPGP